MIRSLFNWGARLWQQWQTERKQRWYITLVVLQVLATSEYPLRKWCIWGRRIVEQRDAGQYRVVIQVRTGVSFFAEDQLLLIDWNQEAVIFGTPRDNPISAWHLDIAADAITFTVHHTLMDFNAEPKVYTFHAPQPVEAA
jgi:hypothetical protein